MPDDSQRPTLTPEDLQFADLVVAQGICSREKVDECLSFIGRLIADGVTPVPRLGEFLVRKGYLTSAHLDATLRPAATGAEYERVRDLPPDIADAARDPANNLGKYVKGSRLGAGGMGEVWRGWDRELRRWVALKFLHVEDAAQIARFRREAQTAAALNHPHIASVYEVGETKGKPFIAMQYISGQTLATVPRNDPRALVELVRDAARAIHYAHEQGVIHRDLKPANLMVESSGGKPRLYVMDFGLAKPMSVASSLSQSGQVLGTPAYMAPEQALGHSERVSARSDVYSLGATLYELFADRPPFQESEVYALLRKVVDEDAVPLRRRNPRVERDLETIVMKCLEKDPAQRYATAGELADDLTRWLNGEGIQAHPPSMGYRLRKFAGRRKALLGVAAAGIAVAAVLLAATLREKSEKEALRELGELRAKMLQLKEWIRQDFRTAQEIRGALDQETRRISDFIERHPRLPQGYFVRAQGRLLQGRMALAEQDLDEALRREPRFTPGWTLLGRVRLERYAMRIYGELLWDQDHILKRAAPLLQKAEEAFRKGWTEEGDRGALEKWGLSRVAEDGVNDRLIEAFRLEYIRNDSAAARATLAEAFRRAPSEEYCRWLSAWSPGPEERMTWIERAVRIAPHSGPVRADLACMRYLQKDWDAVIAEASRAIDLNPHSAVAYNARAGAWLEKRDPGRCVEDCSRAIQIDPEFAFPYATRSGGRLAQGDLEGAIRDATRALEMEPKFAVAYANRAGVLLQRGESESALKDCDRALALDSNLPIAHANRSAAHLVLGDRAAALRDAERAIELDPLLTPAYVNRGNARARREEREAAIADYSRALEQDPNLWQALVGRSAMHLMGEKWDDAIRDCSRALEINPRAALAWSNRGFGHQSKGDHAAAIADATKAIELGSSTTEAYIVRADSRMKVNDREGALADYEKALALAPANWPHRPELEAMILNVRASAPDFPFDEATARKYQNDFAGGLGKPVEWTAASGLRFILVPPGKFLMGSPPEEPGRKPDEARHEVTLTQPFYLGRFEVTVGQFRKFVEATKHVTEVEKTGGGNAHTARAVWQHTPGTSWMKPGYVGAFEGTDDHPVVHVSHLDARAYCRWLDEASPEPGWTYGLPTEAEWEWACRAGSGSRFSWGPDVDASGKVVNAGDQSLKRALPEWPRQTMPMDDRHPFAAPVGSYRANAFGLHDLLGNVWEFCSTKHGAYPAGAATDPGDLGAQESYDVRGGGWSNEPADVRCAARNADPPKFGHSNLGFRVALHPR